MTVLGGQHTPFFAIKSAETEERNVHTVDGKHFSAPQRGINIINGKKEFKP